MFQSLRSKLPDILAVLSLLFFYLLIEAYLSRNGAFFVITPLKYFFQVLDTRWLKDDLFRSLFYLHSQPPVFNLMLGLGVKYFGKHLAESFQLIYQLLAVGIILLLYANQRALKVSWWLAWLITLGWMVYPAFLYFQRFLFYPILVQFLLLLATFFLNRAFGSSRLYMMAFFLALFVLFATRSTYNLLYVLLVLVALLLSNASTRRAILLAAVPGLVLILAFTAKNYLLFEQLSPSSWLGMNLSQITLSTLTDDEKDQLIAQDIVSPVVGSGPFNDIAEYPEEAWREVALECRGPEALCQPHKDNGEPNFNFIGYLPISNAFLQADLYVIRHYPGRYLEQVLEAWRIYFSPAHLTLFVNDKSFAPVKPWADITERLLCGNVTGILSTARCRPIQVIYLATVLVAAIGLIAGGYAQTLTTAERNTLIFLLLTLVYAALVGITLDLGENNRFRFETEPLFMLLLSYVLQNVVWLVSSRLGRRKESSP